MALNILVTGASGLIGSYLMKAKTEHNMFGTVLNGTSQYDFTYLKMDATSKKDVKIAFDMVRPDVVIHCAGEARAYIATQNPEESRRINYAGTCHVSQQAAAYGAHFVYLSSNAVFGGDKAPYDDDAKPAPINTYGRIKFDCEMLLDTYPDKCTIIRPILVYGWPQQGGRENMASLIVKSARRGEEVNVIRNLDVQPTYAADVATAILEIIEKQTTKFEKYNLGTHDKVDLVHFALSVVDIFDLNANTINLTNDEFMGTKRPVDTTFTNTKINQLGIKMRNIQDGLRAMKEEKNVA